MNSAIIRRAVAGLFLTMLATAGFGEHVSAPQKDPKEQPTLGFPTNLKGKPGEVIVVPLILRTPDGLESADLAISYDTTRLEIVKGGGDVTRGKLIADFDLFLANVQDKDGTIRAGMGRSKGPIKIQAPGTLIEIKFRIKANAPAGQAIINLQQRIAPTTTALNDGNIKLKPAPEDKAGDPCDGVITVVGGK